MKILDTPPPVIGNILDGRPTGLTTLAQVPGAPATAVAQFVHLEVLPPRARNRICEELRRQGIPGDMLPRTQMLVVIVFPSAPDYLGQATYDEWVPQPRTLDQTETLWPENPPEQWKRHGIPHRRKTRPIPHAQHLADLIASFLSCRHENTVGLWDYRTDTLWPHCDHCGHRLELPPEPQSAAA